MRTGLRYRVAGVAGRWLIHALMSTVRFRPEHEERYQRYVDRGEPVIFALWHGRLLPLTFYLRGRGIVPIISQSSDGEYIARVVEGWGYEPVRGSTSRGGRQALRALVKSARRGRSLALTPDGPRGPRQKLQPGVIRAAQLTGLPIIPLAAGTSRAWWPGGWDRFCVPKPFARVRVLFGEPRHVPREADEAELQEHAATLEAYMNEIIDDADRDGGPDR